ncbi:MAG: hypothetical protein QNJ16_04970 [Rhodobacter sp.]|nr:hypothetical protein [Rhodobacter sp.]
MNLRFRRRPDSAYLLIMRLALFLALLATPLHAWEFTANPVCTLTHTAKSIEVTVTYDPRQAEAYAIAVTQPAPWPAAPVFSIHFDGPRGLTISTARHRLSNDNATLTVSDTGFGNVLNGLEFNATATAVLGDTEVPVSLEGAAPAVREFRACSEGGLV